MAQQLPPKSQTLSSIMTHPNWISTSPAAGGQSSPPTWVVDDFADFTSSRRNSHRRSASDLVAFLPMLVDGSPPNSSPTAVSAVSTAAVGDGFDGIDDEQLMSMFADEMGMRGSVYNADDPSTPSDHNSNDIDGHDHRLLQKPKEEVFHDSMPIGAANLSDSVAVSGDTIADPKRIKRILANRQSARRSRVRKLQYISELERSVTTLQTEVSTLSPRVAFLDHQRLILNVDNSALKQRIAALIQDKIFKDAHQEAMKKEIERLRQVYHDQNFNGKSATVESVEKLTATPNSNDENRRSGEN